MSGSGASTDSSIVMVSHVTTIVRNQIHFPGEVIDTPKLSKHQTPMVAFVVGFINLEVIQRMNRLLETLPFKNAPADPLVASSLFAVGTRTTVQSLL